MSFNRLVPAAVPSEVQSSVPCAASKPVNRSCPDGSTAPIPVAPTVGARLVPAAVPSVTHSTRPAGPSALNIARPPPIGTALLGPLPFSPGLISRSSDVPPVVVSVTQSSLPFTPSLATKVNLPPPISANTRFCVGASVFDPALNRLTSPARCVPAEVPSVTQTSVPVKPSFAANANCPPPSARNDAGLPLAGKEGPDVFNVVSGLMSLRTLVPAAVPSVIHNSRPTVASVAANNTRPSVTAPISVGVLLLAPGTMSLTSEVPAAVPSLTHNSRPVAADPSAENTNFPPGSGIKVCGPDPAAPGLMSSTREVPPDVPSAIHSSTPLVPSLAANTALPPPIAVKPLGDEPAAPARISAS